MLKGGTSLGRVLKGAQAVYFQLGDKNVSHKFRICLRLHLSLPYLSCRLRVNFWNIYSLTDGQINVLLTETSKEKF